MGDDAPDFTMTGTDGKTYKLSDFKGKQAVVVAWYPRAFTGGCTKECKAFKEQGGSIREYDVAYFTASTDPVETNKKFAESLGVDYPILSDPDRDDGQGLRHLQRRTQGRPAQHVLHRGERQRSCTSTRR